MTAIACTRCDRPNAAHRGYCGGCGAVLRPVCRGCRFVNDAGDVYCGGCGNQLVMSAAPAIVERVVAAPPAQLELPQNVTQGDLDRLFGGGA